MLFSAVLITSSHNSYAQREACKIILPFVACGIPMVYYMWSGENEKWKALIPDFISLFLNILASRKESENEGERAGKKIREGEEVKSGESAETNNNVGETLRLLGVKSIIEKNYPEAESRFKMAMEAGNVMAKTNYGESLVLQKLYLEAVSPLEERVVAGDKKAQAYLGYALYMLKENDKALYHLSESAEAGEPFAKDQIGYVLFVLGQYEKALAPLWEAAEAGDDAAKKKYLEALTRHWESESQKVCLCRSGWGMWVRTAAIDAGLLVFLGVLMGCQHEYKYPNSRGLPSTIWWQTQDIFIFGSITGLLFVTGSAIEAAWARLEAACD